MERSSRHTAAIERVRRLRTEGVDTNEAKEQAKLLRMELLFDNALIAQELIAILTENPLATAEDLRAAIDEKQLVIHPDSVDSFIQKLIEAKEQVQTALLVIEADAQKFDMTTAELLYRSVTLAGKSAPPQGTVTIDTSHPLAITLYVEEPEDFERIDTRKNIGGFFSGERQYEYDVDEPDNTIDDENTHIQLGRVVSRLYSFPFIALKGGRDPLKADSLDEMQGRANIGREALTTTYDHEKGHAENRILGDAVKATDRKAVWGSTETTGYVKEKITTLIVEYDYRIKTFEQIQDTQSWKDTINYALTCAKNELLAEAYAMQGQVQWHIDSLKNRGGTYDYFMHHLGINPDEAYGVYDALWSDYLVKLDEATKPVMEIIGVYRYYRLQKRIQLFRWVLGQIPMEQWAKQLEGTLFTTEANLLEQLEVDLYQIDDEHPFGKRQQLTEQEDRAYSKFRKACDDNQHRPLLPYIRDFFAEIPLPDQAAP